MNQTVRQESNMQILRHRAIMNLNDPMLQNPSSRLVLTAASILACASILTSCGRPGDTGRTSTFGFTPGVSREQIAEHLAKIGATVVSESHDQILAEFREVGMPKPMQAQLTFEGGKLKSVSYIPK